MSDSQQILESLFGTALELAPEERASFLDRECRGDAALRRELEELLAADAAAERYFDRLIEDVASAAPLELESAARANVRIGPYRTVELIGQGGMGVVYKAVRDDGEFDREVALKLLHLDMDTPSLRARFLAERQILAGLSHPGIAHLLDGGVTDEGRPFFVMDYIEGLPIVRYCRREGLRLEAILRLFLDVVDAVAYLHRHLIVHRDLKPGNLLVNRGGQVKLLDFGIAKLLAEGPASAASTRTGQQLLTPEYAAPEQLSGAPVTTATDVYALGGVLFELLTGRRPFERPAADIAEARNRVLSAPSSVLAGTVIPWRRLAGDLDSICLKALSPEPKLRYASAEQLGHDIERHLEGRPVRARRSTIGYRASRFVRRRWRVLAGIVALLIALGIGLVRERSLRGEAETASIEASRETAKAVAISEFLGELLSTADPAKAQGRDVTVAEVVDQAARRLEDGRVLAGQPRVEASVRLTLGKTYQSLSRFDASLAQLERALELLGGPESTTPEAIEALEALGELRLRREEYPEATKLAERVLEVRSRTLGDEHPQTLAAIDQLASSYWAEGRYEEVEPLDRRTLEARRRLLGPEHPDTLGSMNGLGATLFGTARYSEAAKLFGQALEAQKRLLGERHPDTLNLANNLAACYMEQGHYPQAEGLLREVLEARRRILEPRDPRTWTTAHNLALTLLHQAEYDEAEELLRRVVEFRRAMLGDKRGYCLSRTYLADLVRDRGRLGEAEDLYREVLDQSRSIEGGDGPLALKTAAGLAELRLRQGRLAEAEALISGVLESVSEVVGATHPDRLGSITILARLRNAQGIHAEAVELSDRVIALADSTPAFDSAHPLVLEAQMEKALALRDLGRLDEAKTLAAAIYEGRLERLGAEHPLTLQAQALLGTS